MFQAMMTLGKELSVLEAGTRIRLQEIPLFQLEEGGVKAVILDIDNTIASINDWEPTEEARRFVESARENELTVVLLSNVVFSWREKRAKAIADILGTPLVCAYWPSIKPRTEPFVRALKAAEVEADEALMIGDQLIADVLGAQRLGIKTLWIESVGDGHPYLWVINLFEWFCCRTLGRS